MILKTFKSDIEIIKERDPAARILEIFLCYPGFQSIVSIGLHINYGN